MKTGDFYQHYKGGEYYFDCIALPLNGLRSARKITTARYHENTHDIQLFIDDSGTTFIDSALPHVIYQSEKDYDTDKVWAREVDDFFGYKEKDGRFIKRFALKD
jgi:hypothetical protein